MQAIIPYLTFNGSAEQALKFYGKAFNGETISIQRYADMPDAKDNGWGDKIMHAVFQAGELSFMVSDIMDPGSLVHRGTKTSLSLNFDSLETINETFAALSRNAEITMPLQDTFWGARFGMLTDMYGINWMFNHDYPSKENKADSPTT